MLHFLAEICYYFYLCLAVLWTVFLNFLPELIGLAILIGAILGFSWISDKMGLSPYILRAWDNFQAKRKTVQQDAYRNAQNVASIRNKRL